MSLITLRTGTVRAPLQGVATGSQIGYNPRMIHPSGLTADQIEEYLHRSYTRADGLWFVLAEERFGFDAALGLDEAVWKVLPKIQARLLQQQLKLSRDLAGLTAALQAKLALDRYRFTAKPTATGLQIALSGCPWHELMIHSGRQHLSDRVGGVICGAELPAFAREFDCSCVTPREQRLCRNGAHCVFGFYPLPAATSPPTAAIVKFPTSALRQD